MLTDAATVTAVQQAVASKGRPATFDDVRAAVATLANAKAGIVQQALVDAGFSVDLTQIADNAADKANGAAVRAAELQAAQAVQVAA